MKKPIRPTSNNAYQLAPPRAIPSPFDVGKPISDFHNLSKVVDGLHSLKQYFLDQETERDNIFALKIQEVQDLIDSIPAEIERMRSVKRGEKGDPGDPGDPADLETIIEYIQSQVRNGEDGKPGTNADEEVIATKVLGRLPDIIDRQGIIEEIYASIRKPEDGAPGAPGASTKPEDVLPLFIEYLKQNPLKVKDIQGLEELHRSMWNQIGTASGGGRPHLHGGGDTLKAGMGYTLQRNPDGTTTLILSGSSGNSVYGEEPTGSGFSFVLANTPSTGTLRLFRGGARLVPGAGQDYTLSGKNITLALTLQPGEILVADYNY